MGRVEEFIEKKKTTKGRVERMLESKGLYDKKPLSSSNLATPAMLGLNLMQSQTEKRNEEEKDRLRGVDVGQNETNLSAIDTQLQQLRQRQGMFNPQDSAYKKLSEQIALLEQRSTQLSQDNYAAKKVQAADGYEALAKNTDYEEQASKVQSTRGGLFDDIQDEVYEYINNINSFRSSEEGSKSSLLPYSRMTDSEIKTYNYLYNTQGKKSADEYLSHLRETLNYRSGKIDAKYARGLDNDAARAYATGLIGVGAGVDSAMTGLKQSFTEKELPAGSYQYAADIASRDIKDGTFGQIAFDASRMVGAMAPSILASSIAGVLGAPTAIASAIGSATQGLSAGGNAYNQALKQGHTERQAKTYGRLIGAAEGSLQYLLGGISKLGGVSTEKILQKVAGIEKVLLRIPATAAVRLAGEVSEEELQLWLEPAIESLVFNTDFDAPDWEEMAYTALLTAITTGVVERGNLLNNPYRTASTPTQFNNASPATQTQQSNLSTQPQTATEAKTNTPIESTINSAARNEIPDTPTPQAETTVEPPVVSKTRVRGFSENVATDSSMESEIRQAFAEEPEVYEQLANADTLAKAEKIYERGFTNALAHVQKALGAAQSGSKLAPEIVPLSRMVANEATRRGDIGTARQILADTAAELTQAGQLGQAARILRNADPYVVEQTVQNALDKINEALTRTQAKNWKAELTSADLDLIYSTDFTDPAAFENVYTQIAQRIGAEMPATLWQKATELRRISMLLNPRTAVRNVVGNVPMAGLRKVSERLSGAIQGALVDMGALDANARTRTVKISSQSRDLATQLYEQNLDAIQGNPDRYDMTKMIRDYRTYFGDTDVGKALDEIRKFTYAVLEKGDTPFLRSAFVDSAAQYIEAQGYTDIKNVPPEVIDFATQNALEATFRDASALAQWVNEIKREGGAFGAAFDVLLPFTSTPINIARRTIEYSPAGFISAISKAYKGGKTTEVIDAFSKAFTGSAAIAAGWLLARLGLITGGRDDDKDKAAWDKATGNNPYSVGGKVSYDWAQPFGTLFAIGAEINNALKTDATWLDAFLNAAYVGGDAMLNLTVFQNVLDLFKGYGSPTEQLLEEVATSAISQFVPSFGGAIARAVDPTVRTAYTGGGLFEDIGAQIVQKTPFASKNLPASVDVWGREVKRAETFLGRAWEEGVAPYTASHAKSTEIDNAIEKLYGATNDKTVFPRVAPYKISGGELDGEALTGKEREAYQKTMGQLSYDLVSEFVNGSAYSEMTDEQKADVLSKIYEYANDTAKREVYEARGHSYESDWDKVVSISNFADYQAYKTVFNDINTSFKQRQAGNAPTAEEYEIFDILTKNVDALPKDVATALSEVSGFEKAAEAVNAGIGSELYFGIKNSVADSSEKSVNDAVKDLGSYIEEYKKLSTEKQNALAELLNSNTFDMIAAGVSSYDAFTLQDELDNVKNRTAAQTMKIIADASVGNDSKLKAVRVYSKEQYPAYATASKYGVDVKLYNKYKTVLKSLNDNDSVTQNECRAALEKIDATKEQKAIIYAVTGKSWKNGNPYGTVYGNTLEWVTLD